MTDLTDFGAFDDLSPPRIQKQDAVEVEHARDPVAWLGPVPERSAWGVVRTVERDNAYIEDYAADQGGCYALNRTVLDEARRHACQRVLVVEEDTGDVHEWFLERWAGNTLPQRYETVPAWTDARQVYGVLDEALHWTDHASDVFIPQDVRVRGDYQD